MLFLMIRYLNANTDTAAPPYQEALRKSGYNHNLEFSHPPLDPSPTKKKGKSRSRKVTWFNPPWNSAVKTNVGKQFLRLIDTSFSRNNPLRKLFNRSTVKVSYKCMPNMSSLVSSHNTKLLQGGPNQQPPQGCNCRGGPCNCPLSPAECQKDQVSPSCNFQKNVSCVNTCPSCLLNPHDIKWSKLWS